jgi:hypothetical protein
LDSFWRILRVTGRQRETTTWEVRHESRSCFGNRAVSQALGQQIEALEKRLRERVSLRAEYRLLRTVPGIGDRGGEPGQRTGVKPLE